ncbi:MAG: arginyltransferase [Planctomycetota bacterium]
MEELHRFTTERETCPYLPDREATMEYRVVREISPEEYDTLLEIGWRRFGSTLLRPVCDNCQQCVPIRLSIANFHPTRNQRRAEAANRDVTVNVTQPTVDLEHVELYLRYHAERHASRNWPAPKFDLEEYLYSFVANAAPTLEFQYRVGDRLIAVSYAGESERSLNSIYAYLDPDEARRSLGTFNIVRQLREAELQKKEYLYLGFWIRDCPSMTYKARFRPHQLYDGENWNG